MFFRSLALGAVALLAVTDGASAAPNCAIALQNQGCSCIVPIVPGSPVGKLSSVAGDVKKTGAGSYTAVTSDTPLKIGDGVLLGKDGKAFLTAGPGCQPLKLASFTSVVVREVSGCACIASVDAGGAPVLPAGAAGAGGVGIAPLVVFGGGLAAALALQPADVQNSQ